MQNLDQAPVWRPSLYYGDDVRALQHEEHLALPPHLSSHLILCMPSAGRPPSAPARGTFSRCRASTRVYRGGRGVQDEGAHRVRPGVHSNDDRVRPGAHSNDHRVRLGARSNDQLEAVSVIGWAPVGEVMLLEWCSQGGAPRMALLGWCSWRPGHHGMTEAWASHQDERLGTAVC
eukprot:363235-Chlamydomonas_euryale.AAC.3